jgi:shikimate 5-dehydrogenase
MTTSAAEKRRDKQRENQRSQRQMHAVINLTPVSMDGDHLEEHPEQSTNSTAAPTSTLNSTAEPTTLTLPT